MPTGQVADEAREDALAIRGGFANGKLWLFQCRPFLGNDQLKNVPALAPLEGATTARGDDMLSLEEKIG